MIHNLFLYYLKNSKYIQSIKTDILLCICAQPPMQIPLNRDCKLHISAVLYIKAQKCTDYS